MANDKVTEAARLSGHGLAEGGKLVKFLQDVFPHVLGDIKRVAKEELDRVDAKAKQMGLKGAVYEAVSATKEGSAPKPPAPGTGSNS